MPAGLWSAIISSYMGLSGLEKRSFSNQALYIGGEVIVFHERCGILARIMRKPQESRVTRAGKENRFYEGRPKCARKGKEFQ